MIVGDECKLPVELGICNGSNIRHILLSQLKLTDYVNQLLADWNIIQ